MTETPFPRGKNCANCAEMKAKIPVIEGRISYEEAKAECRQGMITDNDGRDIVFNVGKVFSGEKKVWPGKKWTTARYCMSFDDMRDKTEQKEGE
jgi:hypothetical protein